MREEAYRRWLRMERRANDAAVDGEARGSSRLSWGCRNRAGLRLPFRGRAALLRRDSGDRGGIGSGAGAERLSGRRGSE